MLDIYFTLHTVHLLVVLVDGDHGAGAGRQHNLGVGAHAGQHLADEVVGLADEDGLVRVVVAQAEALVGVTPGQVPVIEYHGLKSLFEES